MRITVCLILLVNILLGTDIFTGYTITYGTSNIFNLMNILAVLVWFLGCLIIYKFLNYRKTNKLYIIGGFTVLVFILYKLFG